MTFGTVVLDTNCLVSALLFRHGQFAWLRQAWQGKYFIPLVSQATAKELLRVLAYPKFKLSRAEQQSLLEEFLPYAKVVSVNTQATKLPNLRDPDDLIFLSLALSAKADAVITEDADLHAIKANFPIPILSPTEFRHVTKPGADLFQEAAFQSNPPNRR